MLESIENIVTPVIAEVAITGFLAIIAWFNRRLPEKHRLENEAKHRAAFKEAIDTGVGLIFDMIERAPAVASFDAVVREGIETAKAYVRRSVPDAIGVLLPPMDVIEDQLRSKLQKEITKRIPGLEVDRLSELLRGAGLPQAGLPVSGASQGVSAAPTPGVYSSSQRP